MSREKQKKELRNQRRFVEYWLSDPDFSSWFRKKRKKRKQDAQLL